MKEVFKLCIAMEVFVRVNILKKIAATKGEKIPENFKTKLRESWIIGLIEVLLLCPERGTFLIKEVDNEFSVYNGVFNYSMLLYLISKNKKYIFE